MPAPCPLGQETRQGLACEGESFMRVNDAILGLIAIILGIVVFVHVQSFPSQGDGHPGPSLFPSLLSGLFAVAGCVLIAQGLRIKNQPWFQRLPELDARGIGNIVMTLLAIVFYILASETLGFLLTSFIIMFSLMVMLKAKALHALPVATAMTLFIYLVFNKGLLVPLPRGLVFF